MDRLMRKEYVVVFMFTIVLMILECRCGCGNSTLITISPFPLFLDVRKDNPLEIGCCIGKTQAFRKLQIGRMINGRFYAAAESTSGQPPKLSKPSSSNFTFRPQGRPSVIGTDRNFSLILEAVAVQDLSSPWKCMVNYPLENPTKFSSKHVSLKVLAHPGDIQLLLDPDKSLYNRSDIVDMQCTANTAVAINDYEQTRYRFQYFSQGRWVSVNESSGKEIVSVNTCRPERQGNFIIRPYSISLKVSSIPGCSRRFRCFTFYGNKSFDKEAAEGVISVRSSQCSTDKPDLGSPAIPPPVQSGNDTILKTRSSVLGSLLISNESFMVITITGGPLLLVMVILTDILTRCRPKKSMRAAEAAQARQLSVKPASVFQLGPFRTAT